ncbi:MAG: hypothetical protein HYU36_18675 [Planctomycetes bacterium]|nr:hypothetical protein [Planctomycetota bacterium]
MNTSAQILPLALVAGILIAAPVYGHQEVKPDEKAGQLDRSDPLKLVSDLMKDAESRLSTAQTGDSTQVSQERALSVLDHLIEAAEKQQQQQQQQQQQEQQQQQQQQQQPDSKPSKSKEQAGENKQDEKSRKPADQEKPLKSSPGQENLNAPLDALGQEWGSMPPQLRRELIDSLHENMPERYKELLKLYYKELSDSP